LGVLHLHDIAVVTSCTTVQ